MTDSAIETRCPACQTVFAVEAVDLERAGGRVRCGDCMQVFNARAHATRGPDAGPDAAAPGGDAPGGETVAGGDDRVGDVVSFEIEEAERGADGGRPGDHAEEIDDSPFTATNWFIVDEAGELAPMDGATNDETADVDIEAEPAPEPGPATEPAADDEPEVVIEPGAARGVDDSGAFRFGDDTPPDTLRAELEALVGDDVGDVDDDSDADGEDEAEAEAEGEGDSGFVADELAEAAAAAPGGAAPAEVEAQDDDWDDLLGELDEAFDAPFDAVAPAAPPAPEPALELELEREAEDELEPEHVEATPADYGAAPLDFELVETDEAGNETSLDLDLTRATGETRAADFELLDDEVPSADIAPVDLELSDDAGEPSSVDIELASEPDPGVGAEAGAGEAAAAGEDVAAAGDAEGFDDAALDDMMDALRMLGDDVAGAEVDGAAHDAVTEEVSAGDDVAEATAAAGDAEAEADEATEPEPDGADALAATSATGIVAIGEDTINAMAEGERGEVIVLGGETDSTPVADFDEDDPSFAESMILSPDVAPQPRRTGLWLSLSAVAALGLLLQAVHSWRGTLATMPYWQDALPRIYGAIGVTLAPDWDIRAWCVETSGALASEDGLDIEAIFSNRGDTPLPPPELKLRIVDAYSNTLAATVISPADYLAGADATARVAPGARIDALARLDYNEPRLDGYEVSLCYANPDGTLRCGTGCPDGG